MSDSFEQNKKPNVPNNPTNPHIKDLLEVIREEKTQLRLRRQKLNQEPAESGNEQWFGIAMSGGGIRSATINMGILKTFNRFGILQKADYLSSVSGGGYCGSYIQTTLRAEVDKDPQKDSYAELFDDAKVDAVRTHGEYLIPGMGLYKKWNQLMLIVSFVISTLMSLVSPAIVIIMICLIFEVLRFALVLAFPQSDLVWGFADTDSISEFFKSINNSTIISYILWSLGGLFVVHFILNISLNFDLNISKRFNHIENVIATGLLVLLISGASLMYISNFVDKIIYNEKTQSLLNLKLQAVEDNNLIDKIDDLSVAMEDLSLSIPDIQSKVRVLQSYTQDSVVLNQLSGQRLKIGKNIGSVAASLNDLSEALSDDNMKDIANTLDVVANDLAENNLSNATDTFVFTSAAHDIQGNLKRLETQLSDIDSLRQNIENVIDEKGGDAFGGVFNATYYIDTCKICADIDMANVIIAKKLSQIASVTEGVAQSTRDVAKEFALMNRTLNDVEYLRGRVLHDLPILIRAYLIVLLILFVLGFFTNPNALSFHRYYRKQLSDCYLQFADKWDNVPLRTLFNAHSDNKAEYIAPYPIINTCLNLQDVNDKSFAGTKSND